VKIVFSVFFFGLLALVFVIFRIKLNKEKKQKDKIKTVLKRE